MIENVLPFFENKEYCQIVYDTFSCDETFFQTAIMANQEKNGIVTDEEGNYMNRRWYYIFNEGHPILLNEDHLPEMLGSGMLFARKFDPNYNNAVLDQIDNHLA